MSDPDKYIVIKRSDWNGLVEHANPGSALLVMNDIITSIEVKDATVIRGQDLLAGPALHSYAAGAALVARLLPISHPNRHQFQRVADVFHERALQADAHPNKKVPD